MTNNENNILFEDFLKERMNVCGFDVKKLSESSGVSSKNIESLLRGDFSSMPPAPYFHGFLNKLGQILDFDPNFWWERLKLGGFIRNSGADDKLPKNRFIKELPVKAIWITAGIIVIGVYLLFQLPKITGIPSIEIISPSENPSTSFVNEINIEGIITNADRLEINGELIPLELDGRWNKDIVLEPGLNSFEIKASKFLGKEKKFFQQVIYENTSTATTTFESLNSNNFINNLY